MIIPIFGALDASRQADRGVAGSRRAHLAYDAAGRCSRSPSPAIVAGSIFTFALTLGDFITPILIGGASSNFIGNVIYSTRRRRQLPFAAAMAMVPIVIMSVYLLGARRSAHSRTLMACWDHWPAVALRIWVALSLLFLFIPIGSSSSTPSTSPPSAGPSAGFDRELVLRRLARFPGARALWLSVRVGLFATGWRCCSARVASWRCTAFGSLVGTSISLLLILPIALPGIITGIALSSFFSFAGSTSHADRW